MTWSKKKPTANGWYWYRGDIDAVHEPQPVVVHVENRGGTLYGWQPFMDYDDPLELFTGEWWRDPIAPPPP